MTKQDELLNKWNDLNDEINQVTQQYISEVTKIRVGSLVSVERLNGMKQSNLYVTQMWINPRIAGPIPNVIITVSNIEVLYEKNPAAGKPGQPERKRIVRTKGTPFNISYTEADKNSPYAFRKIKLNNKNLKS